MSKRKQDTVEAVEAADPAQVVAVEVEAVEPEQQAVTQPPENEQPPEQPPVEQAEPGYRVVWHVKIAGTLHAPGSRVELDDAQAAPFLASGAIA